MPDDEKELWLDEAAIHIAKTGPWGVNFLLAFIPYADDLQLRSILLALSFPETKLSTAQRSKVSEIAKTFLGDNRPLIVADAIDALRHLGCRDAIKVVSPLLNHASPYVVGSVLRFFACHAPKKAVPLLEKALKSEEPIIRQNAIDELDHMNYRPALPKIRQLRRDPDKYVRQAARTAVANLENGNA